MRKNILILVSFCTILLMSFSPLLTPVSQAFLNPDPIHGPFPKHEEAVAPPTPTATQTIPAIADPNLLLTLAGVIAGFIAVVVMLLALRANGNK